MDTKGVIAAINQGHTIRVEFGRRWGQFPKIFLSVDGNVIGEVNCLNCVMPTVVADGPLVRVRPGKGVRRGFSLQCNSNQEADWLAQVLALAIKSGFQQPAETAG